MATPGPVLTALVLTTAHGLTAQTRLLPAEVIADLRNLTAQEPARRAELASVLRAAFGIERGHEVRLLSIGAPDGRRPTSARDVRVTMEVVISDRPAMAVQVMGSLDPADPIRFGRQRRLDPGPSPRASLSNLLDTMVALQRHGVTTSVPLRELCRAQATSATCRFDVSVGQATVLTRLTLQTDPARRARMIAALDARIAAVRTAVTPMVRLGGQVSCTHLTPGDEFRVGWRGVGFTAHPNQRGWSYSVCGIEATPAALAQLGDVICQHREFCEQVVGARPWSAVGRVGDRGFLVLFCPRRPPVDLPADGRDNWLRNNARASLLVPVRGTGGIVIRMRHKPLRLAVQGGAFPRPFELEVTELALRIRWSNPRQPPALIPPLTAM